MFSSVFALNAQSLEVLSVNDGAYPEITVRVKLHNSKVDSFSITEKGNPNECSVMEVTNPSEENRMFVFLVENSYFFFNRGVFPEIKKALCDLPKNLGENTDMNVLFFSGPKKTVKYLSAEQTKDYKLLSGNVEDFFLPQNDTSFIENRVYQALEEALDYTIEHGKNNIKILTVITRALNLSQKTSFSDGFLQKCANSGVYINVVSFDSKSYNIKHELQDICLEMGGDFSVFNEKNLEAKLVQIIEKSGKVKPKFTLREYIVKFNALQQGLSNNFIIRCGSLQALCEYTNPGRTFFFGKYPYLIIILISFLLILSAVIIYFRTRNKIIRKIDASSQLHIKEIQRENRTLKREIEKYRKHPDSVLKNFEKFDIEKNLVGPGKIIPRLLIQDGDKKMVFELSKMIMTIGRGQNNDIVVDNRTVSANHAALSFEGGLFYITDNNSTNGTFINDIRITKGKICPEDIVRLGAVFAKINY